MPQRHSRRRLLGLSVAAGATGLLTAPLGLPALASATRGTTGGDRVDVLRTPLHRFSHLHDHPFAPHFVRVRAGTEPGTRVRMHYVDERPRRTRPSGETVVLLHGEPAWSYAYRHMIPTLVGAGHRCVAPDLVGFGRSDKPVARQEHTYNRHVAWTRAALFDWLDLWDVTLVCHDWGGLVGLRLVAENPERFRRVVAMNTYLPTGDRYLGDAFMRWRELSQQLNPFDVGHIVDLNSTTDLALHVRAGYDAPYPDESYKAGPIVFPLLVPITPDDPAAEPNRRAWASLEQFDNPFLTLFSAHNPVKEFADEEMRQRIPGTRGQPHTTLENAGHFLQEDAPELGDIIAHFIATT